MDERKSSKCDHMKREWSKGVAASAMEKANEFDSDVIKENSEYIKKHYVLKQKQGVNM